MFLLRLFTCSTTREKCSGHLMPSFWCRESSTSPTVVLESYLKDLVWPFSRKTLSTLGMKGVVDSLELKLDGCRRREGQKHEVMTGFVRGSHECGKWSAVEAKKERSSEDAK